MSEDRAPLSPRVAGTFSFESLPEEAPPRPSRSHVPTTDVSSGPHISTDPIPLVPPPRPPKNSSAAPPPIPQRRLSSSSPMVRRNGHHNQDNSQCNISDHDIAELMNQGYSFSEVMRALSIAKNNLQLALQILRNYVPTAT